MNSVEIGEGVRLGPPAALRRWGIYTLMVLMVVMALVTTVATSPVLRLLHPQTDG